MIKYQVSSPGSWGRLFGIERTSLPIPGAPGAGCDGRHHSGSGMHGQHRRHATTEVVPRVESDHRDLSGRPGLFKAAECKRVPTCLSKGAPCPSPQRELTMVKPHNLLQKGSDIKAVFLLAPLQQRPCMGEFPCSRGGGVASSNHQLPRQCDQGQDTEGHHPTAEAIW